MDSASVNIGSAYAIQQGPHVIVLLHGAPAFGAVERYVVAVAEGLRQRGMQAILVYPDVAELCSFAEIGGSVRPVALDPQLLAGPAPRLVRKLVSMLGALDPRLVHVTDVWPAALVAARLTRPGRLLVTHHTPELPRRDNLAGRFWWRLGWLVRPEVVYTSETDRRADGRRRLRSHVVPLGIDLDRFGAAAPSLRKEGPLIGNVARLAPQKGHDVLIEAARLLRARRPDVRFAVAGGGELRGELAQRVREAGVEDTFALLGERGDVPALLASFDVFAFPSRFEGLCLAVIEAQAAGVPVVATPVGGIRETVVPGETGLLVPVDDPVALADALAWVLDHPAESAAMAAEARSRAGRFSEARMVEATMQLYGVSD